MVFRDECLDLEGGSAVIDAYSVPAGAENIRNWLDKQAISAHDIGLVRSSLIRHVERVLVIGGMSVPEEMRGQGVGGELLDTLLAETTANAAVLLADSGESQAEGFSLTAFYESRGFVAIFQNGNGDTLMCWPEDVGLLLRENHSRSPDGRCATNPRVEP